MRNTIWSNGCIPHLLGHAWPTICIGSCIDPALDLLGNKRAVGASANFDAECCGVAIERKPFLVAIQHDFNWTPRLTRQACNNSLVANECFGSKRASHRWTEYANPVLRKPENTREIHTQVERRLCPCPDFEAIFLPERDGGMRFHVNMLCPGYAVRFLDDHICCLETRLDIAVPDAEAVTDIRALLRAHPEVCRIVVGDGMMLMDKWRILRTCLQSIVYAWNFFVLDIDQVHGLFGFAPCGCGNGNNWVTRKTHPLSTTHPCTLATAPPSTYSFT